VPGSGFFVVGTELGGFYVEIQQAHTGAGIHLGQIIVYMPTQRTVDQPLAVLDVDGKTIDQRLLLITLSHEIEAVLVFGVQHQQAPVREKADRVACPDDENVTDEIK
jgi:hypothetical protein